MVTGIGAAGDFYRVRLMHVDDVEAPEFEWREDILYRAPEVKPTAECELFRIEAVTIDDREDVTSLGVFDSAEDAYEALDSASEDLAQLTRSEFEARYFPADV
jgi:hypothetical protein